MEELENERKYNCLEINGIIFEKVQVFIWKNKIELINSWGNVVATIYKDKIKTINI